MSRKAALSIKFRFSIAYRAHGAGMFDKNGAGFDEREARRLRACSALSSSLVRGSLA